MSEVTDCRAITLGRKDKKLKEMLQDLLTNSG